MDGPETGQLWYVDSATVWGYSFVDHYLEVTPTGNAGEYRFTMPDNEAVTIAAEFLPHVESIAVPKPNTLLLAGETVTLTASIQPQNAEKTVTWSSSDPSIATVDGNGKVTAKAGGTANIRAVATNGTDDPDDDKETICPVKVLSFPTVTVSYRQERVNDLLFNPTENIPGTWAFNAGYLNSWFSWVGTALYRMSFTPEDSYYQPRREMWVPVRCVRAVPEVTAPEAVPGLTYTGTPHTLVTAGSTNGGKLQYSTDGETWSEALPTGTNAGAYSVYYRILGDDDYQDIGAKGPLTVQIDKVALTLTVKTRPSPTATLPRMTALSWKAL